MNKDWLREMSEASGAECGHKVVGSIFFRGNVLAVMINGRQSEDRAGDSDRK